MDNNESELRSKTELIPINDDDTIADSSTQDETVNEESDFSCPVCYTDGAESGLVTPACCSHKICLRCYTNIAIRAQSPTCPLCRTEYLPQDTPVQENQQIDVANILDTFFPIPRQNPQMNSHSIQEILNNIIVPDIHNLNEMMELLEESYLSPGL